jgi:hypothetical protein
MNIDEVILFALDENRFAPGRQLTQFIHLYARNVYRHHTPSLDSCGIIFIETSIKHGVTPSPLPNHGWV